MSEQIDASMVALAVRMPSDAETCDGPGSYQPPIPGFKVFVRLEADHSDPLDQTLTMGLRIGERIVAQANVVKTGSPRIDLEIALSGMLRFAIREHALIRDLLAEENA